MARPNWFEQQNNVDPYDMLEAQFMWATEGE